MVDGVGRGLRVIDLRPWHAVLAATDVVVLALEVDESWICIRVAARVGEWDFAVGPIRPADTSITCNYIVYADQACVTTRRLVSRTQAIEIIRAIAHDPRGNVGGPDMPSLSKHVQQVAAPWQV